MMKNVQSNATARSGLRGVYLYFLLFLMQTAGAAVFVSMIIPVYREVTRDISKIGTNLEVLLHGVIVIALIQCGYWLRVRLDPPMPALRNMVLGHIVLFLARLSFIIVSTIFSFYMVNNFDRLTVVSFGRVSLAFVTLFSMFCWTLELERLAKSLQGSK